MTDGCHSTTHGLNKVTSRVLDAKACGLQISLWLWTTLSPSTETYPRNEPVNDRLSSHGSWETDCIALPRQFFGSEVTLIESGLAASCSVLNQGVPRHPITISDQPLTSFQTRFKTGARASTQNGFCCSGPQAFPHPRRHRTAKSHGPRRTGVVQRRWIRGQMESQSAAKPAQSGWLWTGRRERFWVRLPDSVFIC